MADVEKPLESSSLVEFFANTMRHDPDLSAAVAAIQTLIELITHSSAETVAQLRDDLQNAIKTLTETDSSVTSITSGCELLLRFITLTALDHSDFQQCKHIMVERGRMFLARLGQCRQKIANIATSFITDGCTILTHSHSRVVLYSLLQAAKANRRFQVFVTEAMPNKSGYITQKILNEAGIPCTIILDSAIGYIMEKVDLVMVGAEGVVESGGIINKIGTYTMAISALQMNKPFYALAESFKFARLYPLNQQDMPDKFKYHASAINEGANLNEEHPLVDYTPPAYITLLFTDLGILTPSAVSDELIKLYL